jgi:hypothetical protein
LMEQKKVYISIYPERHIIDRKANSLST